MAARDTTLSRFHGLELEAEPGRVFTPRPATEALVDAALERLGDGPGRVADVGTGTGAVAIAIAVAQPLLELWATDSCAHAAALAERNARRLGLAERVHVLHADLLDGVPTGIDLVVANLPYLPLQAAARFPEEPPHAVVSGLDGLEHYRRLLAAAPHFLGPDGGVLLQFHGRVLEAERSELAWLSARLESLQREAA